MGIYTVHDQRIYIREEGQRTGQVALLIHDWSSSWFALSPLLPLLKRRFFCMAVDLPGYGKSPRPSGRISIPDYADLLAELVRNTTDGPIVLVGHSMGGMIALTMAIRHPVLVERMVLLNPTISGHLSSRINWAISPITFLQRFALPEWSTAHIEPLLLRLSDGMMRPAYFAERAQVSEKDYNRLRIDARRRGQGRVRAECFWAMRDNDLRGELDAIEAPSLVLWGAEDNTVPLRDAGVVADEFPSADLRIIPKAGHWPQFEMPEVTLRYIASYLGLPPNTHVEEANTNAAVVNKAAQFLAHSDIGNGLSLAQRTRLAAQCFIQEYAPGSIIAHAQDPSTDLYIVQEGTIEVWSDPETMSHLGEARLLARLVPGQITGELALLDGGRRSADLRAGEEGATVMKLYRDRILALCEDSPPLCTRLIWNIASALALRLRLTNWQLQIISDEIAHSEAMQEQPHMVEQAR